MGREPPGAPSHGRSVVAFYNTCRPHSSLGGQTPDEAYTATGAGEKEMKKLAA